VGQLVGRRVLVIAFLIGVALVPFFLIAFPITMLAPTRHLIAWLAMATMLLLWPPGFDCSGVCGVGEMFAAVALPLFGLAILIKLLIARLMPRSNHPGTVGMRITGALAWLSLGALLAQPLPAFRPDWLPPTTAVIVAAGFWLLFPWCANVHGWPMSVQHFVTGLRWSSALGAFAAAALYASTTFALG
jgi:hypothetical protein